MNKKRRRQKRVQTGRRVSRFGIAIYPLDDDTDQPDGALQPPALGRRKISQMALNVSCSTTDSLNLTQEFLAVMLGSNRATVTLSALTLQNIGYIKYSRGRITVTDRLGLESFACDCYQTVKTEYDRSQN